MTRGGAAKAKKWNEDTKNAGANGDRVGDAYYAVIKYPLHSIAIFTVTNKMLMHAEALGAFFPSSPQCRDHLRLLPDRRASAGGKAESLGQWLESGS